MRDCGTEGGGGGGPRLGTHCWQPDRSARRREGQPAAPTTASPRTKPAAAKEAEAAEEEAAEAEAEAEGDSCDEGSEYDSYTDCSESENEGDDEEEEEGAHQPRLRLHSGSVCGPVLPLSRPALC